jgi:hypothetical protein
MAPSFRDLGNTKQVEITFTGPKAWVSNFGGTVIIENRTKVVFEDTDSNSPGGYSQSGLFVDPLLRIDCGCEITSDSDLTVDILQGRLEVGLLREPGGGVGAEGDQQVYINLPNATAPALNIASDAVLAMPNLESMFVLFRVIGELECQGTIEMHLSYSENKSDQIRATTGVTFGEDAKMGLQWECTSMLQIPRPECSEWVLIDVPGGQTISSIPQLIDLGLNNADGLMLSRTSTNRQLIAIN